MNGFKIGNRRIGFGYKPFIIAEACINHEGDIEIAKKMIHIAHDAGVDCIKFQIHHLENETTIAIYLAIVFICSSPRIFATPCFLFFAKSTTRIDL